jgi:Protein of unknown function (DUF1579)
MKVRHLFVGAAFCAATALWSSSVYSQTKDEKKPAAAKPAAAAQPPAAKPADKPAGDKPAAPAAAKPSDKPAGDKGGGNEMESMMKMMQEMSAPGKEHEALKPLIGSFTCTTKFIVPGAPTTESTGTVERKWILGNRYVQEEVKATMMGMPFEGFGMMGYDKLQKFYHAYWVDSMGTGTWTMTGTADAAGKVLTYTGENFDPMSMSKKKGRSTTDMTDPNKHVMKMYDTGPDGNEFMGFEMTCTRK